MKVYVLVKEWGEYEDYRTENIAVYADRLLAESNRDHLQKEDDEKKLFFMPHYFIDKFDMETPLDELENARFTLFETFLVIADEFDGTDYQQGKKDGLRLAMAIMGDPEWLDFNRGNSRSRDNYGNKQNN